MKKYIFTFLCNMIWVCVFTQTPGNFIFQKKYPITSKAAATQLSFSRSYNTYNLRYKLWNANINNYENTSSNIPNQGALQQINHFQNQQLFLLNYPSLDKSLLLVSKNSDLSLNDLLQYPLGKMYYLSSERSIQNKRSARLAVSYGCAIIGAISGGVYGSYRDLGAGYTISSIVLGLFLGVGVGQIINGIFVPIRE